MQGDFAILANQCAIGAEEHGGVLDEVSDVCVKGEHDMLAVLFREISEAGVRGAGDGLGEERGKLGAVFVR